MESGTVQSREVVHPRLADGLAASSTSRPASQKFLRLAVSRPREDAYAYRTWRRRPQWRSLKGATRRYFETRSPNGPNRSYLFNQVVYMMPLALGVLWRAWSQLSGFSRLSAS